MVFFCLMYGQGSKFFDREILDGIGTNVDVSTAGFCANPVKYFMLLRGCLCARTHVGSSE